MSLNSCVLIILIPPVYKNYMAHSPFLNRNWHLKNYIFERSDHNKKDPLDKPIPIFSGENEYNATFGNTSANADIRISESIILLGYKNG